MGGGWWVVCRVCVCGVSCGAVWCGDVGCGCVGCVGVYVLACSRALIWVCVCVRVRVRALRVCVCVRCDVMSDEGMSTQNDMMRCGVM